MKYEWKVVLGASVFLGIVALIYWFLSYEDAGTVMLIFSFAAYGMLGCFLLMLWGRRKGIPRPEDDPDGSYEAASGEVDFFPSASIWPAGIGLGAIFCAIALIWGNWYWFIGFPLIFGGIAGLMVESEAGKDDMDALHERLAEEARLRGEEAPEVTVHH
jgi:hypothetical protein